MKKVYSIAGLKVELTGSYTLQQVTQLPGFDVFEIEDLSDTNADVYIHLDSDINIVNLTNIHRVHHTEMMDIEHTFSRCEEGYIYEMHRQDGSKIVSIVYDLKSNHVFMSPSDCLMSVKYAMWVAFTLSAIEKNVIPIHASSIVKDSEAVLFLGESGTGKSTHTGLWLKYITDSYLLNDDSPLLRFDGDNIFVCGSPWSGKTHCYCQNVVLLKAIVRLSQYPENKMKCSTKLTSIGAIQPSFPPFLAYDKFFSEKVIYLIDKIIKHIPVYELKCRPDQQAAEIAFATIY